MSVWYDGVGRVPVAGRFQLSGAFHPGYIPSVAKARNFDELRSKMPAEARASSAAMAKEMLTTLDEVRAARNSTGLETGFGAGREAASLGRREKSLAGEACESDCPTSEKNDG